MRHVHGHGPCRHTGYFPCPGTLPGRLVTVLGVLTRLGGLAGRPLAKWQKPKWAPKRARDSHPPPTYLDRGGRPRTWVDASAPKSDQISQAGGQFEQEEVTQSVFQDDHSSPAFPQVSNPSPSGEAAP